MILQRSLASNNNQVVKLKKLEEKLAEVYTFLRLPGNGGNVVSVHVPLDALKVTDNMINEMKNLKN